MKATIREIEREKNIVESQKYEKLFFVEKSVINNIFHFSTKVPGKVLQLYFEILRKISPVKSFLDKALL